MSLLETLNQDIKVAMKAKEREKLTTLRMVKAALQNEQIKENGPLSAEQELTVLAREAKQRRDSIDEFQAANRQDLVEKVSAELKIVELYLPKQLTTEEIHEIVTAAIKQTSATSKADFGKVMGVVMPQVKGKADGNAVNAVVKELLN